MSEHASLAECGENGATLPTRGLSRRGSPGVLSSLVGALVLLFCGTAAAQQYAVPTSTVSSTNWSATGAATIHEAVDEAVSSTTDYAGTTKTNILDLGLGAVTDPVSSSLHILHWTVQTTTNNSLSISLYQGNPAGGALITTVSGLTATSWTSGSYTLTGAQADAITDYSQLYLRIANSKNGSAANVAWVNLEVPLAAGVAPTVTSAALLPADLSSVTESAATLQANVTSKGVPATLTARGFVWNTAIDPTTANTVCNNFADATGVYSQTCASMPAGQRIYFRGYATNATGTGYTAAPGVTFYTEPLQSSAVTFPAVGTSTMTVSWTNHASAAGAIVVIKEGSDFTAAPDPADAVTTYSAGGTAWNDGSTLGEGIVAYVGAGTSVSLDAMTAGTTYYVRVYAYAGSLAETNYQQTNPAQGSAQTTSTPVVPTVTSAALLPADLSSVTESSATLQANVTSKGVPATLTARGFVWNTAIDPTTANTVCNSFVDATGVYSQSCGTMPAGQRIYFRGYATNATGTGYTAAPGTTFYTEPLQSSAVTFPAVGTSTMTISWTNHASAAGAIVVVKEGSDFTAAPDPADAVGTYSAGGAAWNDGSTLGEGIVAYVGAATSVDLTAMTSGTWYYVRVYAYAGSGAETNYQQTSPTAGSQQTALAPEVPTVAGAVLNGGLAAVTDTTAVLEANVTSKGVPATLTARGFVWNTAGTPTTANTVCNNFVDATGVYSQSCGTMPRGQQVYFRGYATNATGTGYSAAPGTTFYTEPNQVISTSALMIDYASIQVSWDPATVGGGSGVIVVMKQGSAVNVGPTDGVEPAFSTNFATAFDLGGGNKVVYRGGISPQTITGLDPTTTYHLAVYAYAGTGSGDSGVNYQQDAPGTANATTATAPVFGTTTGTVTAQVASCTRVQILAPFTGDTDNDGSAYFEYNTSNSWPGTPVTGCAAVGGPSPRTCLATGLTPQTSYWFRVTFTDPDTVTDGVPGNPDPEVVGPLSTTACATDLPMVMFLSPAEGATIGGTERFVVQVFDRDGIDTTQWSSVPVFTEVQPISALATTCNLGDQPESSCRLYTFDVNTTSLSSGTAAITFTARDTVPVAAGGPYVGSGVLNLVVNNVGSAPGGSGALLRRSLSPQICTSCHDVPTHSSQATSGKYGTWAMTCLTCHTPHTTNNIFLIRESITTPNSGTRAVTFFDTTGRSANSFASGLGNGVCEACHTQTTRFRNDGTGANSTHPSPANTPCSNCHGHTVGFSQPGCNGCHGGGNNTVGSVANNYWPDGDSGSPEDDAGRHVRHLTELSARVYSLGLAELMADPNTDLKQKILCAYCHPDPRDPEFNPGTGSWITLHSNGSTEVGGNYGHRIWDTYDPDSNLATKPQFTTTDAWTFDLSVPRNGECANADCHNNKLTPSTQHWYDATGSSCDLCHLTNFPTVDATHVAHISGTGSGATYGRTQINCDVCHEPGAVVWNAFQNGIGHINGAWTVGGTVSLTYTGVWTTGAKGSCGTNSCHNNGTSTTTGTPRTSGYTWGTAIGGCVHCHGDDTNTSAMSGAHTKHKAYLNTLGETGDQPCDDCHVSQTATSHMSGTINLRTSPTALVYSGSLTVGDGGSYGACTAGACHDATADPVWNTTATACTQCHVNTTDVDNFLGADKVASAISYNGSNLEYDRNGHGKKGIVCTDCHDFAGTSHNFDNGLQGANPFRLNAQFTSTNAGCNNITNAACHDTLGSVANHERTAMTSPTLAAASYHFVPTCLSCHDPHGDGVIDQQLFMMSDDIIEAQLNVPNPGDCPGGTCQASGFCSGGTRNGQLCDLELLSCPGGTCGANGTCSGGTRATLACLVENTSLVFNNAISGHVTGGNSDPNPPYSGLCQECHETSDTGFTSFKDDTTPVIDVAKHPQPPFDNTCFVAESCHDDHTAGFGPPLSCGACHAAPPDNTDGIDLGDATHAAHVTTAGFYCTHCHPTPGFNSTSHKQTAAVLDSTSWNNTWGGTPGAIRTNLQVDLKDTVAGNPPPDLNPLGTYDGAVPTGAFGTCNAMYCHGASGFPAASQGTDTSPTWDAAGSGACGTCHDVPGTVTGNFLSAAHPKHVDSAGGNYGFGCEKCHSAVVDVALNLTYPAHVNGTPNVDFDATWTGSAYETVGDTCTNTYCHSDGKNLAAPFFHTASIAWTTTSTCTSCHQGASATATTLSGKHFTHVETDGYSFGCERCHINVVSNSTTVSTKANHVNAVQNINFDTTGPNNSAGTYAAAGETCSNTYCHSDGKDLAAPYTSGPSIAWTTGGTCTSCHDGASATATTLSGKHFTHVETDGYNFGCERCHTATVTNSTTISNKAKHVDAVQDVAFNATWTASAYSPAGETCTNTYCHTDGKNLVAPFTHAASIAWTVNGTCTSCHDGASATATALSGRHFTHVETDGYNLGCQNCHTATVSDSSTISNKANHVNLAQEVAFNATWTGSAYSAAGETCTNTYCHSDGKNLVAPFTHTASIAWTATATCTSCHDGASATATNLSGKHFTHVETDGYNLGCERCHANTVSNSSTVSVKANHATGVQDVVFDSSGVNNSAGGFNPGGETCTNTYCHSDGTDLVAPYTHAASIGWTASKTCGSCHGSGAAVGAPSYANGSPKANSHAGHVGTYECVVCHNTVVNASGGVANPATISNKSLHANGVYNVAGAFTWTAGTKTCSANACHGDLAWGQAGVGCASCHVGANDVDDFVYGTTTAMISSTEWTTKGHGKAGLAAALLDCTACHTSGVQHNVTTNPFRLTNTGNTLCTTALGCHDANGPGQLVDGTVHEGAKHGSLLGGGLCWDCHDPHGDAPVAMIHANPWINRDANGLPTVIAGKGGGADNTTVDFTVKGSDPRSRWVKVDRRGVCQICHDQTVLSDSTSFYRYNTFPALATGDNGVDSGPGHQGSSTSDPCSNCHPSHGSFAPSGGDCTGCHAAATAITPRRKITGAGGDFDGSMKSHHVNDGTSNEIVTKWDCVVCHAEGDSDTGGTVGTYHPMDGTTGVQVKNADTGVAYGQPWNLMTPAQRSDFCMSCHDANGATIVNSRPVTGEADADNATALNPFNDGVTNAHETTAAWNPGVHPRVRNPGQTGAGQPGVVDVKSQFAVTNPSHHAVLGPAYGAGSSPLTSAPTGALAAAVFGTHPNGGGSITWTSQLNCEDCHYGSGSTMMNGHGTTNTRYMLRSGAGTDTAGGEATHCNACHNPSDANSVYSEHDLGAHGKLSLFGVGGGSFPGGCLNCHGGGLTADVHSSGTTYTSGYLTWGAIHGNGLKTSTTPNMTYSPNVFVYGAALGNVSPWSGNYSCGAYQNDRAAGDPFATDCENHGVTGKSNISRLQTRSYRVVP